MAAIADKNVGRLDVTMDDSFAVRGIESIGNFDADREQRFQVPSAVPGSNA